jgi:hypothetical protein
LPTVIGEFRHLRRRYTFVGHGSRHASDNYFVRLDAGPPPAATPPVGGRRHVERAAFEPAPGRRRRGRRRMSGRSFFLSLVAIALIAWFAWATEQPGGVSGTVNGFIEHVRGDVQDASAGPDLRRAASFFNQQYAQTGTYPQLNEEQMTAAGIGLDIDVATCGAQAIVVQTLTVSRLLLAGQDLGEVRGHQPCPTDLAHPAPWKTK